MKKQLSTVKQLTVIVITLLLFTSPGVGTAAHTTTASTNPSQPQTPASASSSPAPALEEAEPNNATTNATHIAYDSEINATLSSPNDTDYYAVDATAGCAIIPRAQLKNASRGGTLQVDLVSPTGEVTTELANSLMSGPYHTTGMRGDRAAYTGNVMEHSGTYYIRVQKATRMPLGGPSDESLPENYRYNLTVDRKFVDKHEPNENGTTATSLNLGETVNATSAGYDSDVYVLNVTAGKTYTVNLSYRTPGRYYGSNALYVYANRSQAADDPPWKEAEDGKSPYYFEANGSTVAAIGTIYDDSASLEFTAETNGTYYLQLVQGQDNANLLDFEEYELTVTSDKNKGRNRDDELNDEPNDEMANATQIEYGENVTATLSTPNDTDYYAVNATAGDAILPRLHLKNMFEGSGIQVDVVAPTGEVTTELSNELISGPQNSVGAVALFSEADVAYTGDVMESNGTYYVRVMEATNFPTGSPETNASDTYRYNLTVNREFVDKYEPNENGSTATSVMVGETLTARFAGYDSDVYALNVTAGKTYTVNLSEPGDLGSDYANKILYVYDNQSQAADDPAWEHAEDGKSPYYFEPNGSAVSSTRSTVVLTAEANGTYYLQVVQGPHNYNLLALDEYELTVTSDKNKGRNRDDELNDENVVIREHATDDRGGDRSGNAITSNQRFTPSIRIRSTSLSASVHPPVPR